MERNDSGVIENMDFHGFRRYGMLFKLYINSLMYLFNRKYVNKKA